MDVFVLPEIEPEHIQLRSEHIYQGLWESYHGLDVILDNCLMSYAEFLPVCEHIKITHHCCTLT